LRHQIVEPPLTHPQTRRSTLPVQSIPERNEQQFQVKPHCEFRQVRSLSILLVGERCSPRADFPGCPHWVRSLRWHVCALRVAKDCLGCEGARWTPRQSDAPTIDVPCCRSRLQLSRDQHRDVRKCPLRTSLARPALRNDPVRPASKPGDA
jgi:hypothetical protein